MTEPSDKPIGERVRRAGEQTPGSMRRIGRFHCIVTAPVTAKVVDVNSLRIELAQCTTSLDKARRMTALLENERAQLEMKLAQFSAAPIERVDGDPEVPQETPPDVVPARDVVPAPDVVPPTEPSRDPAVKARKPR